MRKKKNLLISSRCIIFLGTFQSLSLKRICISNPFFVSVIELQNVDHDMLKREENFGGLHL